MKIIDRQACKFIRATTETLLKKFAEDEGMTVSGGSCRFDANHCTLKVEFRLKDLDGKVVDPIVEDYKRNCQYFGLKPEWLGQSLFFNRHMYKVVGLKSSSRKYPVVVELFGKRYKLMAQTVVDALKKGN